MLNVSRETLEQAEGFDKSNWPDFADPEFRARSYQHYGVTPYWN
jgi:hypothetical protein